jgi:hypothetical protein
VLDELEREEKTDSVALVEMRNPYLLRWVTIIATSGFSDPEG